MLSYRENKVLNFSADQLFEMVSDVRSYPDFLPWCVGSRVQTKTKTHMVADLVIGFSVFRERFTSNISMDPENHTVDTKLVKGPFKNLSNHWKFKQLETGGTQVDFAVEFEFKSRILQRAIEPMFAQAQKRMVSAFEKRAHDLYG